MGSVTDVPLEPLPLDRFQAILGDEFAAVAEGAAHARELLDGRTVWHINSTAAGGGVAELLRSLLAYVSGVGVDTRWAVIDGEPDFFELTKRIHNHLHGAPGDGGGLGPAEHALYESALTSEAAELVSRVRPGDVVFLHDPQTAGMVEPVRASGATIVWRCHVGLDLPTKLAHAAWDFLRPYVAEADAWVFSRPDFVWDGLDRERVWIVPPSIDAFSPKNQELAPEAVGAILAQTGLSDAPAAGEARFERSNGSAAVVARRAEVDEDAPVPAAAKLVTQVSRWDRLKDPAGVLSGFAEHVTDEDTHLVLAGPSVAAVADDPEGADVLAEIRSQRLALPPGVRARVHLACLPMDDVDENAAIVNALQRRSDVVVQKSLAEGFGLTVAEAMWKRRAVIASGRGGILDQITDGENGVLLSDPTDLAEFGAALVRLLADPGLRERLGDGARRRVEERFLGTRHLLQYLDLVSGVIGTPSRRRGTPLD